MAPRWKQVGGRLLLAGLSLVVAVFVVPNRMAGGSWMSHRLALWAALVTALWIASQCRNETGRRILWFTGLLVALGLLGLRSLSYAVLGAEIAEVVALGENLEPGEVLLPIELAPRGRGNQGQGLSVKTKPLLHVAGHLAARHGIVNLGNYQPRAGHFPVRLREEVNPLVGTLLSIEGEPTAVEIDAAARFVPKDTNVDAALVTGLAPTSSMSPAARALLANLKGVLEMRAVSSPRGSAVLLGTRSARFPELPDRPMIQGS